ncbi:MAG TPA: hypothetical protein VMA77_02915 [Solirubrobacteraceae bacterium]|nr:hypothetical protein [Solirubrobacteraceae bacterium]
MSSEGPEPTEEELRAAYEAELKRLRVEHVLLDNVAALANLGMRRTGLAPGTEGERDPAQVRLAIESIRALLPVLEQAAPAQVAAIRDAVSQLQLAFVRIGGQEPAAATDEAPGDEGVVGQTPPAPTPAEPEPPKPGEPGPAQRSGRLWVPGQ